MTVVFGPSHADTPSSFTPMHLLRYILKPPPPLPTNSKPMSIQHTTHTHPSTLPSPADTPSSRRAHLGAAHSCPPSTHSPLDSVLSKSREVDFPRRNHSERLTINDETIQEMDNENDLSGVKLAPTGKDAEAQGLQPEGAAEDVGDDLALRKGKLEEEEGGMVRL